MHLYMGRGGFGLNLDYWFITDICCFVVHHSDFALFECVIAIAKYIMRW